MASDRRGTPRSPSRGPSRNAARGARIVRPGDLEGAWAYHRWRITYADGRVTEPFGADATGLLLYTRDGRMSATIMAADRKPFAAGNPRAASTAERAAAFDGFFSYAGRWRIVAGRVEHRVTVSLNPGLVGTRQWRDAELTGRRLVLSVDEGEGAAARRHELEWRRAGPRVRP
jgi:hypothetical protein